MKAGHSRNDDGTFLDKPLAQNLSRRDRLSASLFEPFTDRRKYRVQRSSRYVYEGCLTTKRRDDDPMFLRKFDDGFSCLPDVWVKFNL